VYSNLCKQSALSARGGSLRQTQVFSTALATDVKPLKLRIYEESETLGNHLCRRI
jgi:hypothetical protein